MRIHEIMWRFKILITNEFTYLCVLHMLLCMGAHIPLCMQKTEKDIYCPQRVWVSHRGWNEADGEEAPVMPISTVYQHWSYEQGIYSLIFRWVLGSLSQVLMLLRQVLLPTKPWLKSLSWHSLRFLEPDSPFKGWHDHSGSSLGLIELGFSEPVAQGKLFQFWSKKHEISCPLLRSHRVTRLWFFHLV